MGWIESLWEYVIRHYDGVRKPYCCICNSICDCISENQTHL